MIERVLPPTVASAESFGDPPDAALLPEEEPLVGRAVSKRRREFTTARHCARRALIALGAPPAPILSGNSREPLWPQGIVGSLTHCDGYRAAALARGEDVRAVGIDAEPHGALPGGVLEAVSLPAERDRLAALTTHDSEMCWGRLLFTAKEAVYKAWFPLTERWLGFEDAEITISESGEFAAHLLVSGHTLGGEELTSFTGHWLCQDGFVLAAVVVSQPHTAAR